MCVALQFKLIHIQAWHSGSFILAPYTLNTYKLQSVQILLHKAYQAQLSVWPDSWLESLTKFELVSQWVSYFQKFSDCEFECHFERIKPKLQTKAKGILKFTEFKSNPEIENQNLICWHVSVMLSFSIIRFWFWLIISRTL